MSAPEFSVLVALSRLASRPSDFRLEAGPDARAGLARRFGLLSLDRLRADLLVHRVGPGAHAEGRLVADVVQQCVVSAEPVPVTVDAPLAVDFVREDQPAGEVELEEGALDSILIEGDDIDLGEAVAQSLLLALDPYPRASDEVLAAVRAHLISEEEAAALEAKAAEARNPFAALKRPS